MKNFKVRSFTSSENDFQKLYDLKNKYENHVNDFGSKKTIKYEASLVPKKCNAKTDFLYVGNDLIGYGYTGHQSWAFDETLLDSNISLCYEEKNLKYAQIYLDKQINRAKKNKKIKTFRAWLYKANDLAINFYLNNGFEISLEEFSSIIALNDFDERKFLDLKDKFNQNNFKITNLKKLKKEHENWESKLFNLSQRVESDIPNDSVVNVNQDEWRAHCLTPWHNSEDFYIVMDGPKWIALSTYNRGDRNSDVISTELTGVLPEYRRRSICTNLKIHALTDLKNKGFKKVFTFNEKNNPMFKINCMLGFKKLGTEVGLKLIFEK